MSKTPSVLLAAESLAATNSGIGRVTRLMSQVLDREVRAKQVVARALSLNDAVVPVDQPLPVTLARGSRARFVFEASRARRGCGHFIYDFLGMSRAHLRIPLWDRPFMTWIHGIEVWEDSRPERVDVARRASQVLVNTEYTRQRAARFHPFLADAKVCWLATETDEPGPTLALDRRPTAMILARMDAGGGYKGHRELIDCWPQVVAAVPEARLLIAGSGPGAPVIGEWAAASSARASIEMRGFVAEADLDALWAETTVFTMPSRGEGFGIVYAEAMRRGVPVVASVHDAAQEVNVDGQTGYSVDLRERDALAERLILLLGNLDHARHLGGGGLARWREHFSRRSFEGRFAPLLRAFLTH